MHAEGVAAIAFVVLTVVVVVLGLLVSWRVYVKPPPYRQTQSKPLLSLGLLFFGLGVWFIPRVFADPDAAWENGVVLAISSGLFIGLFVFYYYANYFADFFPDRVVYRGLTWKVTAFEYKDIWIHKFYVPERLMALEIRDKNRRRVRFRYVASDAFALGKYVKWRELLAAQVRELYPSATKDEIRQWVWENQQERATEEAKKAGAGL